MLSSSVVSDVPTVNVKPRTKATFRKFNTFCPFGVLGRNAILVVEGNECPGFG